MSSALPPIVSAQPPAARAPAPEDVVEAGAFERALGLAASAQCVAAAPLVLPLAAVVLPNGDAPHEGEAEADARPAPTSSESEAERSIAVLRAQAALAASRAVALSPMRAAMTALAKERVASEAPASRVPFGPREALPTLASSEPAATTGAPVLSGAPLALGTLPSLGDGRGHPGLPHVNAPPIRSPMAPLPAADGLPTPTPTPTPTPAPVSPQAESAPPLGAARSDAPRADAPTSISADASSRTSANAAARTFVPSDSWPSGVLPAALALDVRVITSRIAPALRRGGLLESAAGARSSQAPPGLALAVEAARALPTAASTTTAPAISAVAPELASDPASSAATVVSSRTPIPAMGEPESTMRARTEQGWQPAAPRAATLVSGDAAAHAMPGRETRAPEATDERQHPASARSVHAQRDDAPQRAPQRASQRAPQRAEPRAAGESAAEQRSPRAVAAHPHARLDTPRASQSEPAAPVEAASAPSPVESAEGAPVAPAVARSARSVVAGGVTHVPDASTLERAEAALEARFSPARRSADQVTLRFEGEGGIEGRLRVSVRGDQVNARILALDAHTMERLAPELRLLQRALEEQGFRDSRVSMQDLRPQAGLSEARAETRASEDRRQGEPGRRQSGEERRGDAGPDGHRDRRGARDGRRAR